MAEADVDMVLNEVEEGTFSDEADALAALTAAALAINVEIKAAETELQSEGLMGGIGEKIKKWIRKLAALIKRIATEWGAISYSIGVSLTGVSVDVTWSGPREG